MHWCSCLLYVTETELSSYDFREKNANAPFMNLYYPLNGHTTKKILELTVLIVIFMHTCNKMHDDLFNAKQNITANAR